MKKFIIPMFAILVLASCGTTDSNNVDVPSDTTEVVAPVTEAPVDTSDTPEAPVSE